MLVIGSTFFLKVNQHLKEVQNSDILSSGKPAITRSQDEVNEAVIKGGNVREDKDSNLLIDDKADIPNPCTLSFVNCDTHTVSTYNSERDAGKIKVLKEVCDKRGMPKNCWKTLYGIVLTESGGNCKTIGDSGRARGCYQIWYKLHNITITQAEDFKFATEWTLSNLKRNGYPVFRSWAIGAHNSKTPLHNRLYTQAVNIKIAMIK